jgi:hypothetical protein
LDRNTLITISEKITDLAWAAGFFDGEGCTYLQRYSGQNRTCVVLKIVQKDHQVLDKWSSIFKVGTCYFNENRQMYSWQSNTFHQSQFVICLIWPWLGEKKREQYSGVMKQYLDSRARTQVRSYKRLRETAISR